MVEFVVLAVLMLIPLVYLVLMMARLQAGSYAVSQAAREAGRAFVTAPSGEAAAARAEAAARIAFLDHAMEDTGRLAVACDGSPCLRPDGRVETTASVRIPLPLVPAFARRGRAVGRPGHCQPRVDGRPLPGAAVMTWTGSTLDDESVANLDPEGDGPATVSR